MNIGKENEYVEHKKSTSELNAGLISISSILNKHGKGTVYFGVKNNGDICGQEIGQNTLRDISSKISTAIKPGCTFEVNERNMSEGNTFIEVTLEELIVLFGIAGMATIATAGVHRRSKSKKN